jgi:pilus assembly protein Flp/PilA
LVIVVLSLNPATMEMSIPVFSKEVMPMQFTPHDHGQGLAEYAIILMLIALVVIILLATFGELVGNMYSDLVSQI